MLFVAFGALVLMPILTGLNPNVALFTAGLGTLVFQLVAGARCRSFWPRPLPLLSRFNSVWVASPSKPESFPWKASVYVASLQGAESAPASAP